MYNFTMNVIWDPEKAETNLNKHKIHFSDAEVALYDPFAVTIEDQVVENELRFVTVGSDAVG